MASSVISLRDIILRRVCSAFCHMKSTAPMARAMIRTINRNSTTSRSKTLVAIAGERYTVPRISGNLSFRKNANTIHNPPQHEFSDPDVTNYARSVNFRKGIDLVFF